MSWSQKLQSKLVGSDVPQKAPVAASPASPVSPPSQGLVDHKTLIFFLTNLRGHVVRVLLRNGKVYEGVFNSATFPNKQCQLVLKAVQEQPSFDFQGRSTFQFVPSFTVEASNLVQMRAKKISFGADVTSPSSSSSSAGRGFATDTQISNTPGQLAERQLQKWTPDSDGVMLTLEEESAMTGHSHKHWNQFEQRNIAPSSFSMDQYTTPLDRNSDFYKQHEKKAQRLAAQILSQNTSNVHMAEERGLVTRQAGSVDEDEEAKYSQVLTQIDAAKFAGANTAASTGSPRQTSGRYLPPALRQPQQSQQTSASASSPAAAAISSSANATATSTTSASTATQASPTSVATSTSPSSSTSSSVTPSTDGKEGQKAKEQQNRDGKDAQDDKKDEPKKKFTLNPNAKSFSFNPNAKAFTPSFATSASLSSSAATDAGDSGAPQFHPRLNFSAGRHPSQQQQQQQQQQWGASEEFPGVPVPLYTGPQMFTDSITMAAPPQVILLPSQQPIVQHQLQQPLFLPNPHSQSMGFTPSFQGSPSRPQIPPQNDGVVFGAQSPPPMRMPNQGPVAFGGMYPMQQQMQPMPSNFRGRPQF